MFGKSLHLKLQCLDNPKFRILMFGKNQNLAFQCLEKPKFRIPTFGKSQNLESQCLEKGTFRIPIPHSCGSSVRCNKQRSSAEKYLFTLI